MREGIFQPIIDSQIKFEKFEVRWNPDELPDLSHSQVDLTDHRLNFKAENEAERLSHKNDRKDGDTSGKVNFCIKIVP